MYELAKELGVDSKEFLEKLKKMNFPVKSHLSIIDEDTAEIIKQEFGVLKEKEIRENVLEVDFPLTVKDFSVKVGKKPSDILQLLLRRGKFYNINQNLDESLSRDLAREMGFTMKEKALPEEELTQELVIDKASLKQRWPVVTLMGHIDHGKTTLLDCIRKSNIVDKESGGITQHIGAYQVDTPKGRITFIDTPGHETFTAMRSRGADVTDIVILVVSAEEGVKPQTEEAISHARAANVPIVVAINKIDRPQAQPDMVKQQLSKIGLSPEDWGGKTIMVPVSAKTGQGVEELLSMILLEAEILELKADYQSSALGVVLEAKLSKGLGPVVTAIIQRGTLKLQDVIVCGLSWGRVRALHNDKGQTQKEAIPSQAVEIIGLGQLPTSGDKLFVVSSEKEAQEIIARKKEKTDKDSGVKPRHISLENLYEKMKKEELKQFRLILKADTYGTLEAIDDIISKIDLKEIQIQIMHKSIGPVNLSDVILADAYDALIVGFKVDVESQALKKSQEKGIQVKTYQIIYELIADIKAALEGMLEPDIKRILSGRAKVKKVFKLSRYGIIAGCMVDKGKILRNSPCRLLRGQDIVFEGKIQSLKRFKDDVKEIQEGFECGIGIGFSAIEEGDIIEAFREEITTKRIDM